MTTPPITGKPWIKAVGQVNALVDCVGCGRAFVIPATARQVEAWAAGQLIQVAMNNLGPDDRELLISGTCPDCWERRYKDD